MRCISVYVYTYVPATDHPNIQHSMDIWNKAKKLKKALTEVRHLRLILLGYRQARYKHGKTITVEQKYCKSFLGLLSLMQRRLKDLKVDWH